MAPKFYMAAYGEKGLMLSQGHLYPRDYFSYAVILVLLLPTMCANFRKIKHGKKVSQYP